MAAAQISDVRDHSLEAEVSALYSSELAYHNFQHALDTVSAAERIIENCIDEDMHPDAEIVYLALLFHDAGFHQDHVALGFDCKEAYSAALAREHLGRKGRPGRVIDEVVAAIMSTHRDATYNTLEQKVVRGADLDSIAGDYRTFLRNSEDLKSEHEHFSGTELDWPTWVETASATIRIYLSQEIELTSHYSCRDGESAFHLAARENLERLIREAN